MLLGIPEQDQEAIRDRIDEGLHLEEDDARLERPATRTAVTDEDFEEYIEWRAEQPVRRPHDRAAHRRVRGRDGHRRRLTRTEVLGYVGLLAGGRQRDHHPAHRVDRQGAGRAPRPATRAGRRTARSSPTPSKSCCATSHRHRCRPGTSQRRRAPRTDVPEGSVMCCSTGRPTATTEVRGRRRVRHPPQDRPPPGLRLRDPLLPGRRARPAGGRVALDEVLQRFPSGRSTGTTPTGPHLDGAGLVRLPVRAG